MFKRVLTMLSLFTVALTVFGTAGRTANAQAEPTAIIDAAFNDLNAKLGTTLSRTKPSNSSYTWEQIRFGDPSLGCPAPGASYAQVVTSGYKIIITVNGTAYDYRASADGKVLFQCSSAGSPVGAVGPSSAAATITPVAVAPVSNQPQSYTNPVAYIGGDNNVYVKQIGGLGSTALTTDAKGKATPYYPLFETLHFYGFLRWSPDGLNLAFVELNSPGLLYVARSGQAAKVLVRGVVSSFPPFWLPGGQELGYVVATGTGDSGGQSALFQIQAMPVGGGSPRVLGQFSHITGCGGGGFSPDEIAYYNEAGYSGNGLILANTASGGYLYSMACTGVGLGFTPGVSGGWTRPDLGRAALSPDGTQLIAMRFNISNPQAGAVPVDLEKVDIATGNSTPIATQPGVDQVAWAGNTTILYSTLSAPKSLSVTAKLNADQQAATGLIDLASPVTSYTLALWKMPAAGGTSVQLTTTTGRGIGTISATADGANILYSVVPSMQAVVNAANSGQTAQGITQSLPFPFINQVGLSAPNTAVITAGGRPAITTGTFVAVSGTPSGAPTAVPPAANLPPPVLAVGAQAVVSVTGDALNLRVSPTKGAQVLRLLKAGIPVTIVGGPANADGLRWWQIKLADGTTGWVVDQITDSSGTTNTLTPR